MNFTYEGANLGKIIKKFEVNNNTYLIDYLDGTNSNYVCFDKNEKQRIKNIMILQARERQNNMNIRTFKLIKNTYFSGSIISSLTISILQNNNKILSYLFFMLLGFGIYEYRDKNKKIKELEKYKLFLELLPNLEDVNTSKVLKCVEFNNIYQKSFDITTLDEYSYSEVKSIYKTYKLKMKK